MNYHLHSEGRDLGVFSVDELRRRRQSGELSGSEYVWAEGMQEWKPLDAVLGPSPQPVGPSKANWEGERPREPKTRSPLMWVWAVLAILLVAAVAFAVFIGPKVVRQARLARQSTSDGMDVSTKKVTWDRKTASVADANKRAREFRRRQWLDGYKLNADRTAPSDADAVYMIEEWIDLNFVEGKTNREEIAQLCDKLAGLSGSEDPLVLAVTGMNAIEMHERDKRLERAFAAFPRSRHKAYPQLNVTATLFENVDEKDRERVNRLYNNGISLFKRCFDDGSFRPEDQAEIAEIFLNGWGYNFFYRSRSITAPMVRPKTEFAWLSHVLDGEMHIMEAWKARGGGYANTVTQEGWEAFRTHLNTAARHLTAAWELRPDLPIAPCRMIYVALGNLGPQEMRVWFDRTVAAQVDYPRAWKDMRWGLRPRWHGSLEAMLALGKTAVDTGRFDTDVPRMIMDVVVDLESELDVGFGEHIYGREDIWPLLSRMYQGYLAAPSQQLMRDGWRSSYATVAYLAEQYDVAREQLEALNWEPWPGNLTGWGTDLSLMASEVGARTGQEASYIARAEKAYRRQNAADALQQYQELARKTNLDTHSAKFTRCRVAALELEKRLAAGEWIDLLPSATNDPAWEISFGAVTRQPDGAVEVTSDKHGHMLFSRARAGLNFEVRGEFEVVKTSNGDFQAGLVMGIPSFNTTDWYAFRMKRNSDEGQLANFSRGWGKQYVGQALSLSKRNTFHFKFRKGTVEAFVNDAPVLRNATLKGQLRASESEFLVGLGAFNDMNTTTIRYKGIQLRRL